MLTARSASLEELPLGAGYAALGERFVEEREPTPLPEPYLVAFNPDAALLLGLREGEERRPEFLRIASGGARFRGHAPFAAVYAGHQFGSFVPQLGDGRAITLGEIEGPEGEPWEWQLKGAGMTAFSRFGDGRAVLRSTIREYLASEALHALDIPTTRALAIAGSAEPVFRESVETAAVLSRLAPSHVRFGSFELFHYRHDEAAVRQLADYTIERFYPAVAELAGEARYAAFLRAVAERTARLFAKWQAVGFAHGVLNTDNMSILGLTLDYGPYGFMEAYEPGFICNHTDELGRYSFERQPSIGLWNCSALAAALGSLVAKPAARDALEAYEPEFRRTYLALLRAKFGLERSDDGDPQLFASAFEALEAGRVDYTLFFRELAATGRDAGSCDGPGKRFAGGALWEAWLARYRERLALEDASDDERSARMRRANPAYVLRNHLAQAAIEAAQQGDFGLMADLHEALRAPFDERAGFERFAQPAPEGAEPISVSCSS